MNETEMNDVKKAPKSSPNQKFNARAIRDAMSARKTTTTNN